MFQKRKKSLTPAKNLFTVLHHFQLSEGFFWFCQQTKSQSRLQTNPLFESQDAVIEPFQRSTFHEKPRLPPINTKPLSQTQLIPNNQSLVFQSLQPPAQAQDRREESDMKDSPTLYKIDNLQEPKEKVKAQLKKNKGLPMKFGDIVFFKFSSEEEASNHKRPVQSVVTGDGIASNRLECVSCESNTQKNALAVFRKSLFCIENQKKYLFHNKYVSILQRKEVKEKMSDEERKKALNFWKGKEKEEREENATDFEKVIGQVITFGQPIQLRHIYSNCYLTLKSEDLARQNGCVEMTLEEEDAEHSNFKFVPFNNLRNIGDVVSYSDFVSLANCEEENYFLHISNELTAADEVEVNGAENPSALKVNCYLNHLERKNNEEMEGRVLLNGDIVTIYNREASASLTVAQRNVNEYFTERNVTISAGEDKFSSNSSFKIKTLDPRKIADSDSKLAIFIQKQSEESIKTNFNGLWEIQRKKTFDGSVLDISEPFRLKNVATGLFLSLNEATGKVELVSTTMAEKSHFQTYFSLVSKFSSLDEEKSIKYNESLKIRVFDHFRKPLLLGYFEHEKNRKADFDRFSVGFNDRRGDSTRFLFELRASNPRSREFADRISSLVPYLLRFYQFLQDFGMTSEPNKQRPGEELYRYDYEKALQKEKELENETGQLFESLENLNDFLEVDQNQEDESMYKLRQNILNDQKILEILIAIATLIEQMSRGAGASLGLPNEKAQVKPKKQDRQSSNYKGSVEKTPFAIARKHLEDPAREIFKFLYRAIKGNPESSQFILEFPDFIKGQLKFYFPEVSVLLKEAVRCSFLLKKDDIYGSQLNIWAQNIEFLNENAKNIEFQALLLELLAYALVDANDAPIQKYQESLSLIFDEALKQKKGLKLIKFGVVSSNQNGKVNPLFGGEKSEISLGKRERAVVSFPKEEPLIDYFMENNPSLSLAELTVVMKKDALDEDRVSFYVDEFMDQRSSKAQADASKDVSLTPFIDYICSTLKLLAYLIKGRRKKSMRIVKRLGMTANHMRLVLESSQVHDKIKANYLHLFQYFCLDKEPFTYLSRYENRCVIWNDLDIFHFTNPTYGLVINIQNQLKSFEEGQEALRDYESIKRLLTNFWSVNGCEEFDFDKPSSQLHNLIELFLSFLKITRVVVDLGYSDKAINDSILYGVGHIFGTIMEDKVQNEDFNIKEEEKERIFEKNGLNNQNWIVKFMSRVVKEAEKEEVEVILHQATKIFMIFTKIRINLQVIMFLKTFKVQQNNEKELESFDGFEQFFQIYDFNLENVNAVKSPTHKLHKPSKVAFESFFHHSEEQKKEEQKKEEQKKEGHKGLYLDSIFLYSLFSSTFMSVRLRENILKILVDYFNQRSYLLGELQLTEIIDTEDELKVYHELDGVTKTAVSVNSLNLHIDKLLQYNDLSQYLSGLDSLEGSKLLSNQVDAQAKKLDQVPKIMVIVDTINQKFKELKRNPYIFSKMQNILRNLHYHDAFLKVIRSLIPTKPEEFILLKKILKFFEYFVFLNEINQQRLLQHSTVFFRLLAYRFPINRLFSKAMDAAKSVDHASELINDFFRLLEENDEANKETRVFKDLQVLSMLQALLTEPSKRFIPKIQKKVLAKLLKNKRILKFTLSQKKKNYVELRNELLDRLQKESKNSLKSQEKIMFHLTLVQLFGNLCKDFKMGIMQMQKVLVYEQIKTLLLDTNTPFLFKKAYLKGLFEIYISQTEGTKGMTLNANFSANDIAEYLNLLVLPDLNLYTKYLEGLICFSPNTDEETVRAQRLRIVENRYQSSLDPAPEEKPSNNLQASSQVSILKKAANNSNQSGIGSDYKKIIFDPSEYWVYLFGGKSWDNSRGGLLYFLLDCYYEADHRNMLNGFESSDSLTDAFSLIKSTLVRMKFTLQKLEQDFNNLNFSNYYLMIMEGISKLPTKVVTKAGKALKIQNDSKGNLKVEKVNVKEEQDQKIIENEQNVAVGKEPSDALLDKLRTHLIKKRMRIQDFLNLFNISEIKLELVKTTTFVHDFIKLLPKETNIEASEIMSLTDKWHLKKEGPKFVNFKKFCEKMRSYYTKKKFNIDDDEGYRGDKKDINLEETEISSKKDRLLKGFRQNYFNNSLRNNRNNEIKDLAIKFKRNLESSYGDLTDQYLRKRAFQENIRKLLVVLKSDTSEIFLIKMLRFFLEDARPQEEIEAFETEEEAKKHEEKMVKFQFFQNVFDDAGVCAYGLGFIKTRTPLLYIHEAISLLTNCLAYGNFKVQMSILDVLKKELTNITGPFFIFLKSFLINQGLDDETDRAKPKLSSFSGQDMLRMSDDKFLNKDQILKSVVMLLSLFCENCNSQFQNFLREQVFDHQFKQNFVSSNIVLETSTLLFVKSVERDAGIVAATLKTLSEYNMGPCHENQSILCNNKKLLKYLNENIIMLDIDFSENPEKKTENVQNVLKVFSMTVEFLLSLVIGMKNKENILKLVNSIDIPSLINKMKRIFKQRISIYKEYILEENRDYLSPEVLEVIRTGFNIFILLTIFRESFPTHSELQILDFNQPFDKKKYLAMKIGYEARLRESKKQLKKKNVKKVVPQVPNRPRNSSQKNKVGTYIEVERTAKTNFLKLDEEASLSNSNLNNEELERLKPGSDPNLLETIVVKQLQSDTEEEKIKEEFKEFLEMNRRLKIMDCLLFYKGLVGSVEVQRGEELSKIYFQKPFCSDFKTPNIKYHLIYKATRDSDQARLEHLFFNFERYHTEMKHRQRMFKHKIPNFFIETWRSLKDFSLLLIFVINILLLATYTHSTDSSDDTLQDSLGDVNLAITICQLFISFLVVVFCMIERYPISLHRKIGEFSAVKRNQLKTEAGLEISNKSFVGRLILDTQMYLETQLEVLEESKYRYAKILLDPENIYNLLYLAITLIAFYYPLVYCILLVDLIKRSDDLQNIIKAVTYNVNSLIKTALLGCAVIYIFSVIAYLQFSQFYSDTGNSIVYATSLLQAFTSTLNSGLRSGGGIGDALSGPKLNDPSYWDFWVFTLTFFIIINILFINIIFGIIIDTFGELRDERKALIKDVEQKCYICGVDSYDFDTKGKGWLDHIYLEHNVYNYLDFLIYIKNKEMNDCNGIEKYVKELMEAHKIDFLPIGRAMVLEEDGKKKEGTD